MQAKQVCIAMCRVQGLWFGGCPRALLEFHAGLAEGNSTEGFMI